MFRSACLAAVAAALLSLPAPANAYWGLYGYGYPWAYGNGYTVSTQFVPAPPYFAIHPPVYYSPHITARHYGASPYAWLPGMWPITYLPPRGPAILKNPHVKGAAEDPKAVAAGQPLVIENPFLLAKAGNQPGRPLMVSNPHLAPVAR